MDPRVIVIIGLVIGFAGFLIGGIGDNRPLGIVIFLSGFLLGLAGAVWGIFKIPTVGQGGMVAKPLRIGAIGFLIALLGNLLSFAGAPNWVSTGSFIVGFAVMGVGIFFIIFRVSRSPPGGGIFGKK